MKYHETTAAIVWAKCETTTNLVIKSFFISKDLITSPHPLPNSLSRTCVASLLLSWVAAFLSACVFILHRIPVSDICDCMIDATMFSSSILYSHWFTLIRAWIIDHINFEAWHMITYPSPNVDGACDYLCFASLLIWLLLPAGIKVATLLIILPFQWD